jgi:shikimate dehydrogenase
MDSLFTFNKPPDPYAVMGNPITHSKSPQIHQAFAQQTNKAIIYQAIHVDRGGFRQAVGNFFANGGKGLNVTVPFKEEAWQWVDIRSKRAEMAGAVNTIILQENGKLLGENTDGIGLVRDLTNNHHVQLSDSTVLLIGAGGAARGVIQPLLSSGIKTLVIANRTESKAEHLASHFIGLGDTLCQCEIVGTGFDNLSGMCFDLIINATSASLQGELPPLPNGIVTDHTCCYDMMYGAQPTAFMQWATQKNAALSLDGLGMLVEQAAESFRLWRGVKPDTQTVIAMIRQQLSNTPTN